MRLIRFSTARERWKEAERPEEGDGEQPLSIRL